MTAIRAAQVIAGLLLGSLAPAGLLAANLGAVTSYEKTAHGIAGRTPAAEFAVEVWSPQVIRVIVTPRGSKRNVGYALVSDTPPGDAAFSVAATDAMVSLKTSAVTADIELRPDLRVSFKDADGAILNEDLPGKELGMTAEGRKFTAYKRLQDPATRQKIVEAVRRIGFLPQRLPVVSLRFGTSAQGIEGVPHAFVRLGQRRVEPERNRVFLERLHQFPFLQQSQAQP